MYICIATRTASMCCPSGQRQSVPPIAERLNVRVEAPAGSVSLSRLALLLLVFCVFSGPIGVRYGPMRRVPLSVRGGWRRGAGAGAVAREGAPGR